jgi:hypothetical protein
MRDNIKTDRKDTEWNSGELINVAQNMDDSANKGIKFRVALKAEYVFRS